MPPEKVDEGAGGTGTAVNGGTDAERTTRRLNFTYRETDVGPFRVMVEKTDSTTYMNKMRLGMDLKSGGMSNSVEEIKKVGKTKAIVYFNGYKEANKLVVEKLLDERTYRCYVPKFFVTTKGVLQDVDLEFTESEVMENIESAVEVVDVYRMNRYVDGVKKPIRKMGITFRCNKLPKYVRLFLCNVKVEIFIPKTIVCENCLRYGHQARNCKNVKTCSRCAETHEESVDCSIRCKYCQTDEHMTRNEKCPYYQQQKAIDTVKAKKGMIYQEVVDSFNITTSNCYELLDKLDEFPTIQESFASVVRKVDSRPAPRKAVTRTKVVQQKEKEVVSEKPEKVNTGSKRKATGLALYNQHVSSEIERFLNTLTAEEGKEMFSEMEWVTSSDVDVNMKKLLGVILETWKQGVRTVSEEVAMEM
jgi:hypothetical protein